MTKKGGIGAALLTAVLSVVGWGLKEQYNLNNLHENRITVLEESKADKEVVTELRVQVTKQTAILETQTKLLDQQFNLLEAIANKH